VGRWGEEGWEGIDRIDEQVECQDPVFFLSFSVTSITFRYPHVYLIHELLP
jgi:hypothetical protein